MASVQKYILSQRTENIVKKTEHELNVWKRFFLEVDEERNIEDIPAHELNIWMSFHDRHEEERWWGGWASNAAIVLKTPSAISEGR